MNSRRIAQYTGPLSALMMVSGAPAAPPEVQFTPSASTVDVYDFVEVAITLENPSVANPFTEVLIEGEFGPPGHPPVKVDGFCDSPDGTVFRIRFMPTRPGPHHYTVVYRQGDFQVSHTGTFTAHDAGRRGLVRVDPEHPWHFLWEGTGEHYFWNGTTAYWLVGWDEETIFRNLDRLHHLKVNRVRAVLNGRVRDGRAWFENVYPTDRFTFLLNPWVAARPDSVEDPGFDVTRFNVAHWQKYERLLHHARELDMIISVIFYVDGARPGVDPFGPQRMGGEDERRYYRYAVARLAPFSNVMWDVTNEYHLFRDEAWTNQMGLFLKRCDPYDHLTSVHGHSEFPFRTAEWADFAMHQQWDEAGGYHFIRACRDKQAQTGRIIPQVNEEYGYEDHYPTWGGHRKPPARSADNRRRLAWGMYMAGGYQTTGERADTGTGWGPDTGGGWINGRGDHSMVMLQGYGHIVDFFTVIPWWTLNPDDDLVEIHEDTPVKTELTHLVYCRDRSGQARLYVDGREVAHTMVPGDVSNWDDTFRLALANELTRDRPWQGEYHRVALYDRSFSAAEVERCFRAGLEARPADPLVLYTFQEGSGATVHDTAERGEPLHLNIANPEAVQWLPQGGLAITAETLIASSAPATKLVQAIRESGAFSLEAWIQPAHLNQTGPARIVTLSRDPGNRNFTLGQGRTAYEVRFRTTTTSPNGEPSLWSPGGDRPAHPIYALSSPEGNLAVLYFERGGEAALKPGRLVEGLEPQWYNPRTGTWTPAEPAAGGVFRAPDEEDWVLRLSPPSRP